MSTIYLMPYPDTDFSLPNPFKIDTETLDCVGWRGTPASTGESAPWRLIGFQAGDANKLVLTARDFVADPDSAFGLVPVFSDGEAFFTVSEAIREVDVYA